MIHYKQSFTQKIKNRIYILWLALIALLILMITIGEVGIIDSRYTTQMSEIAYKLIYFGSLVYVIYKINYNKKLLKNSQKLKEEKIRELDERTQWVYEKSGGIIVDIIILGLTLFTWSLAFIDIFAFNTSVIILFFIVLVKIASYFYYYYK